MIVFHRNAGLEAFVPPTLHWKVGFEYTPSNFGFKPSDFQRQTVQFRPQRGSNHPIPASNYPISASNLPIFRRSVLYLSPTAPYQGESRSRGHKSNTSWVWEISLTCFRNKVYVCALSTSQAGLRHSQEMGSELVEPASNGPDSCFFGPFSAYLVSGIKSTCVGPSTSEYRRALKCSKMTKHDGG